MRIAVRHVTRYAYQPPAARAALRLRLFPPRFEGQASVAWRVTVNGEPVEPLFANGLGESEGLWNARVSQHAIEVIAEGAVETEDKSGVVRGLADKTRPTMYLRETELTRSDAAIRALASSMMRDDMLSTLHDLCNSVRDAIDYTPAATTHETSAREALAQGAGVCQDHAHVFISAARSIGAPARYVAGYIAALNDGAHETHGWAEAFLPDLGWVGFDPANRQSPTSAYIRLCAGLDAADAAPIRGAVSMTGQEALEVELEVAQQ